jgi:hypothetical protein
MERLEFVAVGKGPCEFQQVADAEELAEKVLVIRREPWRLLHLFEELFRRLARRV